MDIKISARGHVCDFCGKKFYEGNRPDGLPNGVGFEVEDGTIVKCCCECLISMGKEKEEHGQTTQD